ncbi:MAG TPA: TULIP family P47-like protein [Thermoanaerobaculia bacterium]|nr:TULIP family P47-like protein [Thermoanaerobaculia bacterium]
MSDTGWDIVAAATQGTINTALAKLNSSRQSPISIDKSFPIGDSHFNVKLDCTFGALQITALQQGQTIVGVLITVDTGTLTLPVNNKIDIGGVQMQINMALTYVESQLEPASGTDYNLVIDFTNKDAFSSITINNPPPGISATVLTFLEMALLNAVQLWVGPNGQEVVIATVNVGGLSNYPALVPSQLFYTFNLNEDDPDQTPFAVLIQTISTEEGSFQLNPGLIPSGSTASVAISNNILMSEILLPALQTALGTQNLIASTVVPETITNTSEIPYSSDGNSINITVLNLSTSNGAFQLSLQGYQKVWDGLITVNMTASATLAFEVGAVTNGSQTLSLVVQGEPDVKVKLSLPWWLSWASWILALISPVVLLFVVVIEAILLGLSAAITGQADSLSSSAIGFAIGQVQWNYANYMVVNSVTLPSASPYPLLAAGILPSQIEATAEETAAA